MIGVDVQRIRRTLELRGQGRDPEQDGSGLDRDNLRRFEAHLRRELERNAPAREFFEALDSANRYAILYRLDEAKKPETRERRLRKFVTMLERGEKIH